jgi:prophage regulatory protein
MDNLQSISTTTATSAVGVEFQRLLRIKQVQDRTGMSRSKVYLMIQQGQFPAPLKLGERVALWPESSINHWITQLVEKSKGVAA